MRKISSLPFILLLGLSMLLSACKLPAAVDQEDPGGDPVSLPRAPVTQVETSVAYPLPQVTPTAGVEVVQPTAEATVLPPTPAAVTSTAEAAPLPTQPPPQPPAAPTETPLPPPATSAATRIEFQPGGTTAAVQGELSTGQQKAYVLKASSGQTMTVNLWSPAGDVYLTITGENGQVLLDAASRASVWSGSLPASQDYVLTLTAPAGATSYSVNVTIPPAAAGSQPTATQAARPATPTASASGVRLDPVAAFGRAKFVDTMDSSRNTNWTDPQGNLPDTDNIRMTIENRKFFVTGKQPGFITWWFTWPSLDNFYLETTLRPGTCSGKDAYGVIVRGPQKQAGKSYGYIVAFSCDGAYQVVRLDSANPFTTVTLVDWTKSEHINSGSNQQNVLGVKADGKNWTIYANGYKIGETSDGTYPDGRIGVYVAPEYTRNFTYQIERLAYWVLP